MMNYMNLHHMAMELKWVGLVLGFSLAFGYTLDWMT